MRTIRIGSGAGFSNDRVEPGIELLEKGQLDYFCLECLAERTIAIAQKEKNLDPNIGYNPYLAYRMKKILPIAAEKHVKVITNMGGANVQKAVEKTAEIARSAGISGLKIVGVLGDDIFDRLDRYADYPIFETGERLGDLKNKVAANAYLGCAGIVQALKDGADIVITGRCSDPALFLGPLVYEFNWPMDNYDLMGKGTVVGHLLECSGQVSGGNFCVPGYTDVEDLWHLGFPYADVSEDGTIEISKLEGTGGRVDVQTCSEQLIYEIHDPSSYYTPDCVADFSQVAFEQVGKDRVRVTGATGRPRTDTLKVSVGYKDGYIGSCGLSFGGPKCFERMVLAVQTMEKIIETYYHPAEHRVDIIGYNSLYPRDLSEGFPGGAEPLELRMRVAVRDAEKEMLTMIFNEVDAFTIDGPANWNAISRSWSRCCLSWCLVKISRSLMWRRFCKMKLLEIAHSRTGDKGDISNISVIAYDMKDYEFIKEKVTVELVAKVFAGYCRGTVTRYELPKIGALNFVLTKTLGGGVTRSLRLDTHGKCLCSYLLDVELDNV